MFYGPLIVHIKVVKSIFVNFKEVITKEIPFSKNCESIIIDANINIVFNNYASWNYSSLGEDLIKIHKIEGDPYKLGTKIYFTFLKNIEVIAVVEEVTMNHKIIEPSFF